MKCLTVKEPWASAIRAGRKVIENRTTGALGWSYRGLLGIHASAGWSPRGAEDARVREWWHGAGWEARPPLDATMFSQTVRRVIAVVDLVDVHLDADCCRPWGESEFVDAHGITRRGVVHLVFENIRPLDEPIFAKGRLGLWWPTRPVEASIERELMVAGKGGTAAVPPASD